ncbi:putative inactive patatin protein [Trifolium repens]|nr:putative inactive patatin protein [Trifolium repens]
MDRTIRSSTIFTDGKSCLLWRTCKTAAGLFITKQPSRLSKIFSRQRKQNGMGLKRLRVNEVVQQNFKMLKLKLGDLKVSAHLKKLSLTPPTVLLKRRREQCQLRSTLSSHRRYTLFTGAPFPMDRTISSSTIFTYGKSHLLWRTCKTAAAAGLFITKQPSRLQDVFPSTEAKWNGIEETQSMR